MISPWHKPGSPQWQREVMQTSRGPWCWETEYGCTNAQKAAMGILPAILIIAIIGAILSSKK